MAYGWQGIKIALFKYGEMVFIVGIEGSVLRGGSIILFLGQNKI